MGTALIGLVGIISGAAIGAFVTQFAQRRNDTYGRSQLFRYEAYRAMITSIMEYRKTQVDRWYALHNDPPREYDNTAVYDARAVAWSSYYGVELLASDPHLVDAARRARDVTGRIKLAEDEDEVETLARESRDLTSQFVRPARIDLRSN